MYNNISSNEPINENVEVSWRIDVNRFKNVIYPLVFADSGLTIGEAYIAWTVGQMAETISALVIRLEDM